MSTIYDSRSHARLHVPQLGESLPLAGAEAEQGLGCEGRGVVDGQDQGRSCGEEREGTKAQHLQILLMLKSISGLNQDTDLS